MGRLFERSQRLWQYDIVGARDVDSAASYAYVISACASIVKRPLSVLPASCPNSFVTTSHSIPRRPVHSIPLERSSLVTLPLRTLSPPSLSPPAVGTSAGHVYLWDMQMLSKAATLQAGQQRIVQIDWSDDGHVIVVASGRTVARFELLKGEEKRDEVQVEHEILAMELNGRCPHQCIVTCAQQSFLVIDFSNNKIRRHLPTATIEDALNVERSKEHSGCCSLSRAVYDRTGTKILSGQKGRWICIHDAASLKILNALPSGSEIIGLEIDREGDLLVVYLAGRCPEIYELNYNVDLSSEGNPIAFENDKEWFKGQVGYRVDGCMRSGGGKWLKLRRRLRHPVPELDRRTWDVGCLLARSGHGTTKDVLCASSTDDQSSFSEQHLLHFWNIYTGELEHVLEGPKEGIQDISCHQRFGTLVSISKAGKVYLWAKRYREFWSMFDTGFQELEENEEYIESETEFDSNDKTGASKALDSQSKAALSQPLDDSEDIDIFGPCDHKPEIESCHKDAPLVFLPLAVFNGSTTENANDEALHETLDTPTLQQQQQPSIKPDFNAEPMETTASKTNTTTLPTNNINSDTQEEYHSAGAFKIVGD